MALVDILKMFDLSEEEAEELAEEFEKQWDAM